MKPAEVYKELAGALKGMRFSPPVAYAYNPLEYAWEPFQQYLDRYARKPEVLLLGMNPGPWGMAQTGIPFGEVSTVRDWLAIDGRVGRPASEHPKRPVQGLSCPRREVSGLRLWGWARKSFGTPERFFERFFIANYCPLLFLDREARNLTPDKLPASERGALEERCDLALRRLVESLKPRRVVGIGGYAAKRAARSLGDLVPIGEVLHPSPASPAANRGWEAQASAMLAAQGIAL